MGGAEGRGKGGVERGGGGGERGERGEGRGRGEGSREGRRERRGGGRGSQLSMYEDPKLIESTIKEREAKTAVVTKVPPKLA